MSEMWNAEMRAYDDCEVCGGEGERWLESGHDEIPSPGWVPCDVCRLRRIAELETENVRLQAVAGGAGSLLLEVQQDCIKERKVRKAAEMQRDDLKNALIAIRDEADGKCWEWCDTRQLTVPAEFQVHGMPHFVAREALMRLEGENSQT